jgi:glyoxylase-like metal-dependent hydrolase (beta-lactamase superfamily II)
MYLILEHPREGLVLYDTGYSSRFIEATRSFPERLYSLVTPVACAPEETAVAQLAALGYRPDDVRQVVISHFHADHISALADFRKARFRCFRRAFETVRRRRRLHALCSGFLPALLPSDFEARLDFVDESHQYTLPVDLSPFARGFSLFGDESALAIPLDGHAHGQLGLLVQGSGGHRVFFVADACWLLDSLSAGRRPSPITHLLFDDPHAYHSTFDALRQLHRSSSELLIVPSHCQQTLSNLMALPHFR